MLYRLRDAMGECIGGMGEDCDSRLLLFPASFNAAFRELDRCLTELKQLEPVLHWHVRAWYVDCGWRQEAQYRYVITGGKRRKVAAGWRMVPVRHRDARQETAQQAVRRLVGSYRFERVHLKDLQQAAGDTADIA